MKNIDRVRQIPLFADCAEATLSLLLSAAEERTPAGGEYLCRAGEPFASLCLVLQGKLIVTAPQSSACLRVIGAPGVLGFSSLFGGGTAVSSVQAKGAVRLLLIPQETLEEALRTDPALAVRYIAHLTGRIRFLNGRIGTFTAGSAENRLAQYLLQCDPDGSGTVELGCPISTLAEMLDLGRASLYRAFDVLESRGLIAREGKTVRVPSARALADAVSE